jgi:hypothetical protein
MKKIVLAFLLIMAGSLTLVSASIVKNWSIKDSSIYPAISMLIYTQKDIEQKEKLTLPNPYTDYVQMLALSKKFKFNVADMPEEGRAFLDVLIEDVSGPQAVTEFAPILHNNFAHKELQLSLIYFYIMQRYSNQNKLRWETYERVVGKVHGKELKKHELKYVDIAANAFVQAQKINR